MTNQSFTNYKSNILYLHASDSERLIKALKQGNCNASQMQLLFNISTTLVETVMCYSLFDNTTENPNCLSVDNMKEITNLLNTIHNTAYCVDYVL